MFARTLTAPIVTLIGLSFCSCSEDPAPHGAAISQSSEPRTTAPLSDREELVQLESGMNALDLHLSLIPDSYGKLEINQLREEINAVAAVVIKFNFQDQEERLKNVERMRGFNERLEALEEGIK
jgi:hypothetical protein